MIPQSSTFDFVSHANVSRRLFCPCCSNAHGLIVFSDGFSRWKTRVHVTNASSKKVATGLVADRLSNEFEGEQKSERSSFTSFREDPKPTAPWVGAASWAFISLPKIKFELAPFRLFNLMGIPVLSMQVLLWLSPCILFAKLSYEKGKGKAVGPISEDLKSGDFVGELSVTLVNAQKLPYMFSGRTDPYVILRMGDQVIRSKKNSQNSIGAPGQPIWNQDFQFLVSNPREQVLQIEVNDCLGFADMAIGTGQGSAGELLLRLTYKAYVEDEEDEKRNAKATIAYASDDEIEDFQGIVSSEAGSKRYEDESSMSPVPSKTGENSKSQPEDSGNGRISGLEVKNVNSDRRSADDGAQVSSTRDMVLCGSLATSFAEEFHIGSRDNDARGRRTHNDTTPVIYSAMDVLFWRSKSLNKFFMALK
ncbi:hypothetical protein Bca101_089064 [Brassica carinata]